MPKLDRVLLGIFLLGTFVMAARDARADGFVYNNGTFTSLSVPGASSTSANGINDAGDVVGTFSGASGTEGFLYNGSTYTPIVYSGASATYATGINDSGEIVGYYTMANPNGPSTTYGFVDNGGTFTSFGSCAGCEGTGTYVTGINDAGQVVGYETQPLAETTGFVHSGGNSTGVIYPYSAANTFAYGINNNGEIVGSVTICENPPGGGGGIQCGGAFVDNGGSYTFGVVPNANGGVGWQSGINDAGEIVGTAGEEGFVYQGGTISQLSVPGSSWTYANGVNDEAEIVGDYAGQSIPAPEPGTLALLAVSLVVLAGIGRRNRIAPTHSI
jgi:probable HAF family extracellular repeat protein